MVDFVENFTKNSLDSEGRHLINSDQIMTTYYYDSTGESWRVDYSALTNPFSNPSFNTTITGTVGAIGNWYETGTDTNIPVDTQRFFKVSKLPFNYEDELLAKYGSVIANTPNSNGSAAGVTGDFFVNATNVSIPKNTFPLNYNIPGFDGTDRWATTSGVPNAGYGKIAWQLSPPQEVAGFYIDSYDADETTASNSISACIKEYLIQIGNSGTGLLDSDYTTIVSGTVPFGWTHPLWIDVPPTIAKYVRILFKNNGSIVRSGLGKAFAYGSSTISQGMALAVTRVIGSVIPNPGRTFAINQIVDFTGLSRIYFDVKNYARTNSNQFEVLTDGILRFDPLVPNSLSSADIYTYSRGVSVDVSADGADTVFQLRQTMQNNPSSTSGFILASNFTPVPGWYSENPSATRGSTSQFPNKVFIVVDSKGLSIIDADCMALWMRFDLGSRKMLQQKPKKVAAIDGRIYLATSRGLYVIDFHKNRCTRYDERGVWHRYGIDYRNENSFDFEEWTVDVAPQRLLLDYIKLVSSVVIPELNINDIDVAHDDVFGNFVVLATAKGLVIFNDIFSSAGQFYTSLDTTPTSKVSISNGSIWYLQGEGSDQRVNYISSVNSANFSGFIPDHTYHKDVSYDEPLSGIIDPGKWEIVRQDPGMNMSYGDVLTISGSHTYTGTTGLIYREIIPDRSFSARLKVKIIDFPPDARGAIRFGLCRDYKHLGLMSLESESGLNTRAGFFISAHNIDPYGWPSFGSTPFDTNKFYDNETWFYAAQDRGGDLVSKVRKVGTPTVDGFKLRTYATSVGPGGSDNLHVLNRISSVQPVLARDFTARARVQISSGFSAPSSTLVTSNPNSWFGISRNQDMIPGSVGSGDSVDSAMLIAGSTTFSGTLVYTTGNYTSVGNPANVVLTQPKFPMSSNENIGHSSSIYREWRMDYNHGNNDVSYYLDGQFVGTYRSTAYTNPNRFGLCFGVGSHQLDATGPARIVYFDNLRVEYPTLASGSRYKYGMEVSNSYGDLIPVFRHYPTYSGISNISDITPASGTLSSLQELNDEDVLVGAQAMGLSISVGVALPSLQTVEALHIYDSSSSSGWNSTSTKRIQVWYSADNVLWTFYKEYDVNAQERLSGLTKLRFSPAIESKFFKVRGLNNTYNIPGGSPWGISEIRAITTSGINFSPTDNTPDADFHEWRLDYDSTTKEVRGFIDGVLVSKGRNDYGLEGAKFVLAHDLNVVSSGTDSYFHGEFKDFSVSFSDPGFISGGDISAIQINHNLVSGTHNNYTVITASELDVKVADLDLSGSPVPDLIRGFDHRDDIFGASDKVSTIVADIESHRDQGLVLIGTSRFKSSSYRIAGRRPIWFENWGDEGLSPGDEALSYGNKYTFSYHPSLDKLFIIHDANSAYFTVADLSTDSWYQLSRESFKDVMAASSTGNFQSGSAKAVYSPYDERMWILSSPDRFCGVDLTTGNVVEGVYATSDFESISGANDGTAGRWFIAYILHRHRILFGFNYIGIYDLTSNTSLKHPRNFSSTPKRWNRSATILPWGVVGGNDGVASAVYCDYDKCVYFIGSSDAEPTGTNHFYRYDPDKDYLELITAGSELRNWPTTDSALYSDTPVNVSTFKGVRLIYDSLRKRIYVVAERGVRALLMYYDVMNRQWVEVGEDPPYTSLRSWPAEAPTQFSTDTNFAAYNPNHGSIYLATGRGDEQGSYVYEYFPEEVAGEFDFDYIPSRDGVPPASGIARQFTTFSDIIQTNYTNTIDFNRDFYLTSNAVTPRFNYSFGPSHITISGNGNGSGGSTEFYDLYVSAKEFDPTRSFDISAKIAFPQFTRNILYSPGLQKPAHCYFRIGFSDGLNRSWTSPSFGEVDPNLYQSIDLRVGVSGTTSNSTTQFPFVAHIAYVDGFNVSGDSIATDPKLAYDSYKSGGITLGSAFSDFRDFRLSYTYDTDTVEGFLNNVSIGSTILRRKFNSNGVRFHLGFSARATNDSGNPKSWAAQIKDINLSTKAWDRIEAGRLITSISGSVGTYIHERWDSSLVPHTDWAYSIDAYLPSSVRYSGYDYIASLGGIGDGNKLAELVTFVGPGQKKMVGIVGDLDRRNDFNTYLGSTESLWDEVDSHTYFISKNTLSGTISVYLDGSVTPSISVQYADLPDYQYQHVYYGKVNYGNFEKIYESPTLSGTWTSAPDYTGLSLDPALGKLAFNSDAKFATIVQGNAARAIYALEDNLGDVDLYTFYHATGLDSAKDVPYTILSSGVVALPPSSGEGFTVRSIEDQIDEFGDADPNKITIRIDQRRVKGNAALLADRNYSQASGWIYLGRYTNPSSVVITADASSGPGTSQAFVCADAIGVDIGKYGKSTFDLNVGRVRYAVGVTDIFPDAAEVAGVSVIDLSTNSTIDAYGENTSPAIPDSDISSGSVIP